MIQLLLQRCTAFAKTSPRVVVMVMLIMVQAYEAWAVHNGLPPDRYDDESAARLYLLLGAACLLLAGAFWWLADVQDTSTSDGCINNLLFGLTAIVFGLGGGVLLLIGLCFWIISLTQKKNRAGRRTLGLKNGQWRSKVLARLAERRSNRLVRWVEKTYQTHRPV